MNPRTIYALAASLLAGGCGGTATEVHMDASTASDGAASADVAATPDGAPSLDSATPGDATNGDASGPMDSGIADAGHANADGATPDASCDPIDLVADAGPGTCAFTPADLACKTINDCMTYVIPGCSCPLTVIGVSRRSTAVCVPPPCPPPLPDSGCFGTGSYESQDCIVSPNAGLIFANCVNGQCVSQAALPGH
jgi:hypothetical protein